MVTPFSGGCACGAIRYECSAAPIFALNCHCRDCQRATGKPYDRTDDQITLDEVEKIGF
jgi:hypothetical protein